MKFNLGHILNRIRPKTQWVVTDEKISRWDSEEPEPTLEELEAGRKELEDEWKRKKSTPEFKWAKNNRMNCFRWCSHHWTY